MEVYIKSKISIFKMSMLMEYLALPMFIYMNFSNNVLIQPFKMAILQNNLYLGVLSNIIIPFPPRY